jgi:hypothetical protein
MTDLEYVQSLTIEVLLKMQAVFKRAIAEKIETKFGCLKSNLELINQEIERRENE